MILYQELKVSFMKKILSILLGMVPILFEEARWPFNLALTVALTLFMLSIVGCVPSTEVLISEAKECVQISINDKGVVGQPSKDQRSECWTVVNKRIESVERREKREQSTQCPKGFIKVCDKRSRDERCSCMDNQRVRDMLRRAGVAW